VPALDGQAVAALFPASGEHVAPVLGAHPLEEAMDPLAAAIVGLKSAFHGRGAPGLAPAAPAQPAEK